MVRDGVLRDVIRFFVDRAASRGLTRTRLVKLVFLADYETYRARRQTLTGLEYVMDRMGPLAWGIPDTAGGMLSDGVTQTVGDSVFGGREYRYTAITGDSDSYMLLSADDLAVLRDVWRRFGRQSARRIVDTVHEMPFVQLFSPGDSVDFRLALSDPKDRARISAWKRLRPKVPAKRSQDEGAQLMSALHTMRHGEEAAFLP